jgi:hypothetical protein
VASPPADPEQFYSALAPFDDFGQITDGDVYADAPPSWWVLLTDVVDSTGAIRAGRYKDVNSLGVASICAAQNAAPGVELAFVFGGDGATILGPGSARPALALAGAQVAELAKTAFGLELRARLIPVADLIAAGAPLRVAKLRLTGETALAMLDGPGVSLAEKWAKDPAKDYRVPAPVAHDAALFDGFACRWRPVPAQRGRIVSLLVVPTGAARETRATVARVLDAIQRIAPEARPIAREGMEMQKSIRYLDTEARIRSGAPRGLSTRLRAIGAWLALALGRALVDTGTKLGDFDGNRYTEDTIERTDFRKFDGTLRMVLDLTPSEEADLRKLLEGEHAAGAIAFGLHGDREALITCIVRDHAGRHVHFVDGSGGGYAIAALELKRQLKKARSS